MRIVLSRLAASRGWICAFCIVPVLAIIATALLVLAPAPHRGAAGTTSLNSIVSQSATGNAAARERLQASYTALPLAFEQNQGQTDARSEEHTSELQSLR